MRSTLRRVLASALAFVIALTGLTLAGAQSASAADPYSAYLLVHFTGESSQGEQIYLSASTDGKYWNDLNNGQPALLSTVGTKGVRDPSIVRSPDGSKFWIVATDLRIASGSGWGNAIDNGSRSIVVWESTDLVNWSAPWLLNVAGAIPDGRNAWAPEAIWNPATNSYFLYWATNSSRNGVVTHRIWGANTNDFRSISTPQLYIDRGSQSIIDTQIVERDNSTGGFKYYRASGDGQITIEGSNSILGSWTYVGDLRGQGLTGSDVEGPILFRYNGTTQTFGMFVDQYATGRGYLPLVTTDITSAANWKIRPQGTYSMGATTKRHGSVLQITSTELERLSAKWPSAAKRIQSYNFEDRFVRHTNFTARIDQGVAPYADSQWVLRSGLADGSSGTVSFESVNYPGYFLRHYGFEVRLEKNDGSAAFAGDATFRRVAGLKDSTATSFQSFNFPDRYLRHSAFALRIDPISTDTDRQDATFRVG